MKSPKIVVIGAGSYFFGRPVIYKVTNSPILRDGTLALVDTDAQVLETMMHLGRRVTEATVAGTTLTGSTDRREVLQDADFVVLTFSYRNAHFRGVDCRVSDKYGVKMCSGDTIGPGGIFRALREIPTALAVASDVAELASKAWLINLVNPTTVLGIALMRYAKDVRSFALCDTLHEPYLRLKMLKGVGILSADAQSLPSDVDEKLDLAIAGVNHFAWMLRFDYDGRDMRPKWRQHLVDLAAKETADAQAKARYNAAYALELTDIFGAYPVVIGHTKEYVPFYQGYGVSPVSPAGLTIFDAQHRAEQTHKHMRENTDYAAGDKPISQFLEEGKGDHATDIIESMWAGQHKRFYVNTANRGAVTNMSADAFLELRCDVDMDGPQPLPLGEMPRGLLGLTQQVLDTHELTAEAAATFDRRLVLRALATDPIVNNLGDARKVMDELFETQREILHENWYV